MVERSVAFLHESDISDGLASLRVMMRACVRAELSQMTSSTRLGGSSKIDQNRRADHFNSRRQQEVLAYAAVVS